MDWKNTTMRIGSSQDCLKKYTKPIAYFRESRIKRAEGDVAKFKAIVKEYVKAKDVTKERLYLEAMEEILPGIDKYIVPNGEDGNLLNLLNLTGTKGAK